MKTKKVTVSVDIPEMALESLRQHYEERRQKFEKMANSTMAQLFTGMGLTFKENPTDEDLVLHAVVLGSATAEMKRGAPAGFHVVSVSPKDQDFTSATKESVLEGFSAIKKALNKPLRPAPPICLTCLEHGNYVVRDSCGEHSEDDREKSWSRLREVGL